jgi:hypothetical protein
MKKKKREPFECQKEKANEGSTEPSSKGIGHIYHSTVTTTKTNHNDHHL